MIKAVEDGDSDIDITDSDEASDDFSTGQVCHLRPTLCHHCPTLSAFLPLYATFVPLYLPLSRSISAFLLNISFAWGSFNSRVCSSIREFRASEKSPGQSKLVARLKISACQLLPKKVLGQVSKKKSLYIFRKAPRNTLSALILLGSFYFGRFFIECRINTAHYCEWCTN